MIIIHLVVSGSCLIEMNSIILAEMPDDTHSLILLSTCLPDIMDIAFKKNWTWNYVELNFLVL